MAQQNTASTIFDTALHIARATWNVQWSRYVSWVGHLVVLPLRLVWIPLFYVLSALFTVFAPVWFIFAYFASWARTVVSVFRSLEPLYIFFGVAAAVGILAGITLAISSSVITTYVGMQDDPDEEDRLLEAPGKGYLRYPSTFNDSSSSAEPGWQWDSSSRRRLASGLMSQTIHEEEDDYDL